MLNNNRKNSIHDLLQSLSPYDYKHDSRTYYANPNTNCNGFYDPYYNHTDRNNYYQYDSFKKNKWNTKNNWSHYRKPKGHKYFIETEIDSSIKTALINKLCIKEQLLRLQVKVKGKIKEIIIYSNDDLCILLDDFCFNNQIPMKYIDPLIEKVKNALDIIRQLLYSKLSINDITSLLLIWTLYQNS